MSTKKIIDLADLDTVKASNKPYRLALLHPATKRPIGGYINVLGQESDAFRDFNDERTNENLRVQYEATKNGKDIPFRTIEEQRQRSIELLVACTVGFEDITLEGKSFEFSVPNAVTLYTRFPWIRKQVDDAVTDIANFMPA